MGISPTFWINYPGQFEPAQPVSSHSPVKWWKVSSTVLSSIPYSPISCSMPGLRLVRTTHSRPHYYLVPNMWKSWTSEVRWEWLTLAPRQHFIVLIKLKSGVGVGAKALQKVVFVGGQLFQPQDITTGVPQDSLWGPDIFNYLLPFISSVEEIFTNDCKLLTTPQSMQLFVAAD